MKRLILASLICLIALPAAAQSNDPNRIGLTVFPAINEFVIEAGRSDDGEITIENTSLAPYPLDARVEPLQPFEQITDSADRARFDASSWVSLSEEQFALEAGSRGSIAYQINVPDDAPAGGHYAQISIRPLQITADAPQNTSAQVVPEINALILITVPGGIDESASLDASTLENFTTTPGTINRLSFRVVNDGNVHLLVSPELSISAPDGVEVERYQFPPQLILPGTVKTLEREWRAPAVGNYSLNLSLTYGSDNKIITQPDILLKVTYPLWQLVTAAAIGVIALLMIIRWRQLPRVADALRGRNTSIKGRYRWDRSEDDNLEDDTIDYGSLASSLEAAGTKPILGLAERENLKDQNPINTELVPEEVVQEKTEQEKAKRYQSKTDELVEAKLNNRAEISEQYNTDNHTKTVVIQTSSSTIVREEPFNERPALSTPKKITVKSDSVSVKSRPSRSKKVAVKNSKKKKSKPAKKRTKKSI